MSTPERRSSPRVKIRLAAQIVRLDQKPVSLMAETVDIGAGGVSLLVPGELPAGKNADYLITLSNRNPPATIYCSGRVLRSTGKDNAWTAAITMARYNFVRPENPQQTGMPAASATATDAARPPVA
jgi:hypothetical protein